MVRLEKIDVKKIDPKEGFDMFDLLRNGADLDEQKVSAVIATLVAQHNTLVDIIGQLSSALLRKKGGRKNTSTKS